MSEFSKGKWRADYEENKYIWSSKDKVLGELYFTTPEETKANARLIAAAPEMYELLRDLAKELRAYGDEVIEDLYGLMVSAEELTARIDGDAKHE